MSFLRVGQKSIVDIRLDLLMLLYNNVAELRLFRGAASNENRAIERHEGGIDPASAKLGRPSGLPRPLAAGPNDLNIEVANFLA
jgi:hypothetical protein